MNQQNDYGAFARGDYIPNEHQYMYWALQEVDQSAAYLFHRADTKTKDDFIKSITIGAQKADSYSAGVLALYTKHRLTGQL